MSSGISFTYPELAPRLGESSNGQSNAWPDEQRIKGITEWCEAAWEEANGDQKSSEELALVEKYIEYLGGKQWAQGRPSYRSKPVNNRMYRLFWELVSLLTDIRPLVDIHSTVRGDNYIAQEDVLNQATRAWWQNNGIESRMAMCIVYSMLTSSFCKLEWNQDLQYGMGDLSLVPLSPKSLLPLKPGIDLQDCECLIYQDVKSVGWIKRKFQSRAHLVTPDIDVSSYQLDSGPPAHIQPQLYQMLTPAMKRIIKRDATASGSAYPMCKYREFWLKDYQVNTSNNDVIMGDRFARFSTAYTAKPGEMLYPRGRLIVMAGRNIVHDGPNPYWHGKFPFSLLRLNIVPWS